MESWEVQYPGRRPFTPEEIAQDPRRADLEGEFPPLSREAVHREVQTEGFLAFASGRAAFEGEERTVALASAAHVEALGLGARARAVHLSGDTVRGHDRFADFEAEDWRRVQRIVDDGEWVARRTNHRLVWIEESGEPWVAVLKRTAGGEIYLQSYRRAQQYDVDKWREE